MTPIQSGVVVERIHFGPEQVRTKEGIGVGHFYISNKIGDDSTLIVALTEPYLLDDKDWVFLAIDWPILGNYGLWSIQELFLKDINIYPYSNGWNRTNWLSRTKRKPLNTDQVSDIKIFIPRKE